MLSSIIHPHCSGASLTKALLWHCLTVVCTYSPQSDLSDLIAIPTWFIEYEHWQPSTACVAHYPPPLPLSPPRSALTPSSKEMAFWKEYLLKVLTAADTIYSALSSRPVRQASRLFLTCYLRAQPPGLKHQDILVGRSESLLSCSGFRAARGHGTVPHAPDGSVHRRAHLKVFKWEHVFEALHGVSFVMGPSGLCCWQSQVF